MSGVTIPQLLPRGGCARVYRSVSMYRFLGTVTRPLIDVLGHRTAKRRGQAVAAQLDARTGKLPLHPAAAFNRGWIHMRMVFGTSVHVPRVAVHLPSASRIPWAEVASKAPQSAVGSASVRGHAPTRLALRRRGQLDAIPADGQPSSSSNSENNVSNSTPPCRANSALPAAAHRGRFEPSAHSGLPRPRALRAGHRTQPWKSSSASSDRHSVAASGRLRLGGVQDRFSVRMMPQEKSYLVVRSGSLSASLGVMVLSAM